jgi:hypothetical protein
MFSGGEGGRCVGLTTLPPSYADCLDIWEPQPPGTLMACSRLVMELLYLLLPYLRDVVSSSSIGHGYRLAANNAQDVICVDYSLFIFLQIWRHVL